MIRGHLSYTRVSTTLTDTTRQPVKYEFDGIRPVALPGGTAAHSAIQRNLITGLAIRLRGKPCQAHGSDLKVEVAGSIRYLDAFVVCSDVPRNATVVRDPVVIFEIMSQGTSRADRGQKHDEYRQTSSVARYIMVEQDEVAATVFAREGDRRVGSLGYGREAMLALPEIGIELPLTELYEGVQLPFEELPD